MNKKQLVMLFCLTVSVAFAAYAQQGGYKGPGTTPVTVEEATNLPYPASVIMQGKIVRFLMMNIYLFSDDTGTIAVSISDRLWKDISVDENDTVEIQGIIERNPRGASNWGTSYIVMVQSLRKL